MGLSANGARILSGGRSSRVRKKIGACHTFTVACGSLRVANRPTARRQKLCWQAIRLSYDSVRGARWADHKHISEVERVSANLVTLAHSSVDGRRSLGTA